MLNAKSGIAEMLQPAGGAGSARRQNAGNEEGSGLFGNTLKGQMNQAGEGQKPATRETEKPVASAKHADSSRAEDATPESGGAVSATAAADGKATVASADDEMAAGEITVPDILLPGSVLLVEPEVDSAGDEVALLAEAANDGNILPPALPVAIATQADAALAGETDEIDLVELPRWAQSLVAGRGQAATGRVAEQPTLLADGDDAKLDSGFLKGLQAVTAQLDGQRGEMGGRQGQGQSAEALFKLAGLTAVKEGAAPPLTMAASTVSSTAATTAPAPAPAQSLALDVPLRQSGWDQAFAERVVWMARQGVQEAQIHLNPRNMGPIEVHISMQKEQASVTFVAHHAVTREALEAAMPRLRDMLQDNGLNLAQSEVSQQSLDQRRNQAEGFSGEQGRGQRGGGHDDTGDEAMMAETPLHGGSGMVDYYA